jgi:general secretion pathway protein J
VRRRAGFTLVEVMIAIFIAAVMFAIGYRALNQGLVYNESLKVSQARVTEIQRGMRVMAQDFAQLAARAARDTQGNGQLLPAISADNRDNTLVVFSRTGWSNPAGVQRPAEQRVRYRFLDGSLVREHWLALDAALSAEPRQRIILTRLTTVEIRFLDPVSRTWRTEWPLVTPSGPVSPANIDETLLPRPLAIELTLVLEDWGRVQRVFEVPT